MNGHQLQERAPWQITNRENWRALFRCWIRCVRSLSWWECRSSAMLRRMEATAKWTAFGIRSRSACDWSWQIRWPTINWLSNWVIKHRRKFQRRKSMPRGRARARRYTRLGDQFFFTASSILYSRSPYFKESAKSVAATRRSSGAGTSNTTRETADRFSRPSSHTTTFSGRTFCIPRALTTLVNKSLSVAIYYSY